MDRLIYTAASGARALLLRQDAHAQNLANANTPGFRADTMAFRAVPVRGDGTATRVASIEATAGFDDSSGPVQTTGRSLDVAVQGKGYLAVQAADGAEAYTRNGGLQVSTAGELVASNGMPVVGEGGPLNVPVGAEVRISRDGTVSANTPGAPVQVIGRLKLVNPPAAELRKGTDGLLRMANGGDAEADPEVRLIPNAVEGSNVSVIEAMVGMMGASRQYETQMKLLQNAEQNDQRASQLLAQAR